MKSAWNADLFQKMRQSKFTFLALSLGLALGLAALPYKVQSEKAQAVLKNGILTITVPKRQEPESQGRKLTIRRE